MKCPKFYSSSGLAKFTQGPLGSIYRPTAPSYAMERLYRQALYTELDINQDRLDTENGLDFSDEGLAEKTGEDSLASLMQQCLLLCAENNPTVYTTWLLDDALSRILCINEKNNIKKEGVDPFNNGKNSINKDGVDPFKDVHKLVPQDTKENIAKLTTYYESILQPPPPPQSVAKLEKENTTSSAQPTRQQGDFRTAGQMLGRPPPTKPTNNAPVPTRKTVGLCKRLKTGEPAKPMPIHAESESEKHDSDVDPRLKGIDPKLLETIQNEIIHRVDTVTWEQIAGLEHAKSTIKEIVIWPMLRPDIFVGLRGPPKGLLLFGPPGTGKTMIGKCIASQAKATFFSISASSLTSKWVGEGEKLVRALFSCARAMQPSVIFIDEIDSLLTQRTDGEFEASRRIKTEFLVQFDGAATSSDDRILVIGATNRPQELDEAARRRLVKRLYIPLPDAIARLTIVKSLLGSQNHELLDENLEEICKKTDGYSGADVDNLCREAALGPIRSIHNIMEISADQVRPISIDDFRSAMSQVRASVSSADLDLYLDWNLKFGSLSVETKG